MAWQDFLYGMVTKKPKVKQNELEITCSGCERVISSNKFLTHAGTTQFYHENTCALKYHVGHPDFPWRETIEISREGALAELKKYNENYSEGKK